MEDLMEDSSCLHLYVNECGNGNDEQRRPGAHLLRTDYGSLLRTWPRSAR